MQSRPRRVALAAACVLAGLIVAACTSPPIHNTGVSYTCCSESVVATTWHPGQQLPVVWTRTETVPAGHGFQPVTLSAILTGPFSKVAAAKAAITNRGSLTTRAAKITISQDPPGSAVSVIAIPASAPLGFYNLQTIESSGGGTVTGVAIVSVG
jgi:hypothetical protein